MMTFGMNRQGRMQEQAKVGAVADRPQTARAAGVALIVQFGGVLDGQDMASGHTARNFLAAMLVKLFNGHGLVPQPAAKSDFFGNIARQYTQTNAEFLRHSLRQQRPFFAAVRRRSCQPPSRKIPLPTSRISRQTESHTPIDQRNLLALAESVGRTQREVFTDQPLQGRVGAHLWKRAGGTPAVRGRPMKITPDLPSELTALDRPNSYIGRSVPRP